MTKSQDNQNDEQVSEESSDESRHEKILEQARERYQLAEEAWAEIYRLAEDDLKFLAGGEAQWDEAMLQARRLENRPCFTVNSLPLPVKQLVNDQKQNKPAIKLSPADDFADPETAEIFQGVIRNIENNSNAGAAYTHALNCSAGASIGFFEVRTDYASPYSFDLEPKICRIPDPLTVLLDPYFKEPDGSDANWGFKVCEYSKDDFKNEYSDSELAKSENWGDFETSSKGWVQKDSVRVAEYYTKEYEPIDLIQLSDGNVYDASELDESNWPVDEMGQRLSVQNERKSKKCVVKHYKINGIAVLEETEFPAPYIPLIPALGEEIFVDGKRILKSLIRDAKTSQQLRNLWISSEAEAIALTPKAPFVAAEGQIPKEYEPMWRTANSRTHAYLIYKPTDHKNTVLPPPQRIMAEANVGAITQARMQAADDIKMTTGYHDASMGAQGNEKSGIAIQRRTAQSQTSSFHFIDNLNRSIRHAGRILVEIIPKIYDTQRTVRIIGDEGEEKVVKINTVLEDGKKIDFSVGKYDVIVETGPSFATKRQEASQYMIDFVRAYPQAAPVIGDLIAKNQDWPGSSEISERLKKMAIKQGIIEDDQKDGQPPIPPEIQAQLQQQGQLIEQLTATANQQAEELRIKKYEIDSREKIETMKLENQAAIEMAKLQSKEAIELLYAQIKELDARTKAISQSPIEQEFNGQEMPDQQIMPDQQQPLMEGQ